MPEIVKLVCHPDAMTPDANPLLGPMPGMHGFCMAAGLSLNGFGGAGGIGKTIAEWITAGETELDVHAYRAWRFGEAHRHPDALELPGARPTSTTTASATRWTRPSGAAPAASAPARPHPGPRRGLRREERLGAAGLLPARAGLAARGRRPARLRMDAPARARTPCGEHQAFRERVGIIDMTSFGKIEVEGPGRAGPARPGVREPDRPAAGERHLHAVAATGAAASSPT